MTMIQRKGIDHDPVRPWQWATWWGKGEDPVEVLSYPIPPESGENADYEDYTIMVRTTIGDCRTLREVPFRQVAVFAPCRHEDGLHYVPQIGGE